MEKTSPSGFLETDGSDGLFCMHDDIGADGMWTNGAMLNVALPASFSNGVQYLRYDFSCDLSDTNNLNDRGCVKWTALGDETFDEH